MKITKRYVDSKIKLTDRYNPADLRQCVARGLRDIISRDCRMSMQFDTTWLLLNWFAILVNVLPSIYSYWNPFEYPFEHHTRILLFVTMILYYAVLFAVWIAGGDGSVAFVAEQGNHYVGVLKENSSTNHISLFLYSFENSDLLVYHFPFLARKYALSQVELKFDLGKLFNSRGDLLIEDLQDLLIAQLNKKRQ